MQILVSCDYLNSLLAGQMRIRLKLKFLRVADFYAPSKSRKMIAILTYIHVL